MYNVYVPLLQESIAAQLFDLLDTNGDGIIDNKELVDFCGSHGGLSVSKATRALGEILRLCPLFV